MRFDSLYAIANVPVGRYGKHLRAEDGLDAYLAGLAAAFNPDVAGALECRHGLVVGWDGTLSDCDFNLGAGLGLARGAAHARRRAHGARRAGSLHFARCARDPPHRVRSALLRVHRRGGLELKRPAPVTRSGRKNRICLLTRFPRLGEVKTRLVPPLSAEEALALHDRMARHTLRRALAVAATGEAKVEVRTDAAFTHAAAEWLGGGFSSRYQGEGDLGDRIRLAFGNGFSRGDKRVVVIGSDCPQMTSAHLRDALRRLSHVDLVLGPAEDGGYYLVALRSESAKRSVPVLFSGIPWSTPDVIDATIEIAEKNGLTYAVLETLPDVDTLDDLEDARAALDAAQLPAEPTVSVIIPALDDANCVSAAIASARAAGAAEVIVVDGGSLDATRDVGATAGARVLDSAPGRASQMDAGAAEARGDVLLFLHADTVLPASAAALACETLAREQVAAGGFSFAVPADARHARLISAVGRMRHRLGGPPYGDQGIFMAAQTWRDLGGFGDVRVMEDIEMTTRLRRLGSVVVRPERAVTSARVWDEHGLVRPTAINALGILAYRLGMDPDRIARWRQRIAPSSRSPRP